MTFDKLHQDTDCDCLNNAINNLKDIFARAVNSDFVKEEHFESYWEQGKRPDSVECDKICSFKGVSVNILNSENNSEVLGVFYKFYTFSPKKKRFICTFKLRERSGMVKATPSKYNLHHYDFYKCDTFTIKDLLIIEIIDLKQYVSY